MSHRDWAPIIATLIAGEALDYDQSYWLMDQVMSGELGEARLASFLTAMAIKGATVEEIHGLADGMQDHAASVDLPSRALDIVGTGGDGYKTVNISTMSAIVAASMGIPLVKHGNRASTSKSGSADVIEALGVNLDVEPADLRRIFDQVGIAFLFANKMHPSMRFAAPVRRALGFPTAFNVLGPLTNPAKVQACAIGAAKEENARLMAGVYASRGLSALVLRGATTGLDELTTADSNQIWIVSGGQVCEVAFDARESLGMTSSSIEDLAGGEAADNAAVAREVLAGGGSSAVRDAVALNVGAGILAWEGLDHPLSADTFEARMRDAVGRAQAALADGAGARLVERWAQASNS
jgi:anthranilate phosphoribosyltransferase